MTAGSVLRMPAGATRKRIEKCPLVNEKNVAWRITVVAPFA
jgi:hypothetical protein